MKIFSILILTSYTCLAYSQTFNAVDKSKAYINHVQNDFEEEVFDADEISEYNEGYDEEFNDGYDLSPIPANQVVDTERDDESKKITPAVKKSLKASTSKKE